MENEEKGILVEQVVQADRIRTHGKFHERLFLLLRVIYFLIGMLGRKSIPIFLLSDST